MKLPSIAFPTLAFSGPQIPAGLVIRMGEVELLALQGKKVTSRVRVPIEGKREDADLVKAIQKALSAAALKTNRLAISIPTQDVLFRFFTLPAIPKSEWDTAIQFEARKYIPFKMEGLVWDGAVIQTKSADKSEKLEVIFAAIQREPFKRLQSVLSAAGVVPTRIETRSMSLARLVDPATKGGSANEFVCFVDIERDAAHLVIVKDRLPYMTRDIGLPAGSGESRVAAGEGAPDLTMAPSTGQGGIGTVDIDPRAERLLSEVSVSMDFFMREHPSSTIQQVFLFGDESVIGSWCRWLSDRLHRPVELGSKLIDQRIEGGLPLTFAAAVGSVCLLKDSASARLSLDFLRRSLAKPSLLLSGRGLPLLPELPAWVNLPQLGTGIGGGLALVFALWFLSNQRVMTEQRRFEALAQSRARLGSGAASTTPEELSKVKTSVGTLLQALRQVGGGRVKAAVKLEALARSMPDGVWFTSLHFESPLNLTTRSQPRLMIRGACFLEDADQELAAIQALEDGVKRNQQFFKGFSATRLDQVSAQLDSRQRYTYRTFQLHCDANQRL